MTSKDLWKALFKALELWLLYVVASALISAVLPYGSALAGLLKLCVALLCIYVFVTGFLKIKNQKEDKPKIYSDKNMSDYKSARKAIANTQPKAFKKEMRALSTQVERMGKKSKALDEALKSYFGDSKISYEKFARTVESVEDLFMDNTQRILNRVNIFDEEGYRDVFAKHLEYTTAIDPYNEHIAFVTKRLDENEAILSKMDKLLLEVTQLQESSIPIDQLPAMQEINDLIEQTRLYKQGR